MTGKTLKQRSLTLNQVWNKYGIIPPEGGCWNIKHFVELDVLKQWLEQKLQQLEGRVPDRSKPFSQEQWELLNELLEELK